MEGYFLFVDNWALAVATTTFFESEVKRIYLELGGLGSPVAIYF
jgi:hypothetical protein